MCKQSNVCDSCSSGFIPCKQIVSGSLVNGCWKQGSSPYTAPKISGVQYGRGSAVQGVILNNIPAQLYGSNCDQCGNLLTVSIANNINVKTTIQYVPNSVYWFLVSFDYGSVQVPSFAYTVSLNSQYAKYYTNSFKLQGTINIAEANYIPSYQGSVILNNSPSLSSNYGPLITQIQSSINSQIYSTQYTQSYQLSSYINDESTLRRCFG